MTERTQTWVLGLASLCLGFVGVQALSGPTGAELAEVERLSSERARIGLLARQSRREAAQSAELARVAVADAQAARRRVPGVRIKRDTVFIKIGAAEVPFELPAPVVELIGLQAEALGKDSVAIAVLGATIVRKDLTIALFADSLDRASSALIAQQAQIITRVRKPLFGAGAKKGLVVGGAIGLLAGLVLRR